MKLTNYVNKNKTNWGNLRVAKKKGWNETLTRQIKNLLASDPNATMACEIARILGADQISVERAMQRMRKRGEIELIHYWRIKK